MLKKINQWWDDLKWATIFTKAKRLSSRFWQSTKELPWRYLLSFAWFPAILETLVSIVLKLGTLLLVVLFLVFFLRLFKDQGYVIQEFSVPKQLEEQGYTGEVIAIRIQDKLKELKDQAGSVKEDSLQLKSNEDDIDLAVLGVGFSLRSLAFQMREALGHENKTLRGEITRIGSRYEAQIRMSGFPKMTSVLIADPGSEAETLDQLFKKLAEGILFHTDPYRLALVLRHENRFDEAIETIRHLLRTNEAEAHWGYLGWGSLLSELRDDEGAIDKMERAMQIKPDFSLPYINAAWIYDRLGRTNDAIYAFNKAIELEPDNIWRRNNLAWFYHNNGMHAEADSLFENIMAEYADDVELRSEVASNWVEMKLQRDDVPGAKYILDNYIVADGENVFAYLVKAIMSFAEGDTLLAMDNMEYAFELDPADNAAINANIGFSLMLKNYEHAFRIYREAEWTNIAPPVKANTFNQIAMAYNERSYHDTAMLVARRTIAIDTGYSYPYTTLAETHFFQGENDSCYIYLEKALKKGFNPNHFDLSDAPYNYLKDQLKFQQLLEKYKRGDSNLSG